MSDLISRSTLIDKFSDTGIQITFDLPVEEKLGEDVDLEAFAELVQDAVQAYKKMIIDVIQNQPTAYDVDAVVEEIENINTAWNCQECMHLEICDKIQLEKGNGGESLDLCAEVVKVLAQDMVRKGGVNENNN